MKSPLLEIKVSILGHVSVGKTTVLNALLRDKFSEVAKKRTTASIFQLTPANTTDGKLTKEDSDDETSQKWEELLTSDQFQ